MSAQEQSERTEIDELGEFGLIQHLTKNVELHNASTLQGIGDDAAVLDHLGKPIVVSTDLLLEGIHFDLAYMPLKHLGYKSIVVNLSDIYAMNCLPTQVTVSIGVSNRFSVEALEEFYEGVLSACNAYGVDLIGGDTSSSLKGFVISVTAIGEGMPNKIVQRDTAQIGDLICVSGDLGAAYLGLLLLEREKKIYTENPKIQPDLEGQQYIIKRVLKPEARKEIVLLLEELNIVPTSMIDISDGLSSDLLHICTKSEKGCLIYEDKIPIHPDTKNFAYKLNLDPTACALSGGDDYELLFTIATSDYEKIKSHPHISVIGHIVEGDKKQLQTKSGNLYPLTAQGWK